MTENFTVKVTLEGLLLRAVKPKPDTLRTLLDVSYSPTPLHKTQMASIRTQVTRARAIWDHRIQSSLHDGKPGMSYTAEARENDLKSNLMKTIEVFKQDMNESHKEIEENAIK